MKRRHFLQASGSTIATLAFDQIIDHADRYGQVLAQSGGRKLALLVGINDYLPGDRNLVGLEGCMNDVDLQKELLMHRFGFDPSVIAILKNKEATRQNILQAFEQHLIKQAKPGDVVVFHFSGHGSRVVDPDPIAGKPDNSTFLPYGAEFINPDGTVNDIMGRTLFLLMSQLQTHAVTAVLDSCHAGGGTRGMGTVRTGDENSNRKPSPAELSYQNTLRQRLNLSPQQLRDARSRSVAKGAVIAATQPDLLAMDWAFSGFHAGAFTYLLTQYLWSQPSTYGEAEDILRRSLYSLTRYQSPVFDLEQPTLKSQPIYFTQTQRRSAQAVVTATNGNQAQLWLGGLDPILTLAPGSTFAAIDQSGVPTGTVKLQSRDGLMATASIQGAVPRGALLQETDRLIPNDLRLRIGIDASIGQEIPAVQAALKQIARVEAVPARSGSRPYSEGIDFIISRVTEKYRSYSRTNSNAPINSVGIFSPMLEVLPNTVDKPGETAQAAIARLQVRLQSLVAAYVIRKTLNAESSSLNVKVQLQRPDQPNKAIAQAATGRGGNSLSTRSAPLELNAAFQFQVANNETTPLYLLIALVSPSGKLSILFPNDYTSGGSLREVSQITPQTARLIPDQQDGDEFQLKTQLPGQSEALIITSRKPLDTVYKRVQTLASEQALKRGIPLNERGSGDAIAGLLGDLSRSSSPTAFTVSTADVATLSIPFIVKGS